jgi:dynein heavy chain
MHFEQANYDIMTCSEDIVSYRVFSVVCKKLKQQLGDEANKIKERILEETYNWCVTTVERINDTYKEMQNAVEHDPQDEQELVDTQQAQMDSPMRQEQLQAELKRVEQHYAMLDSFSYYYKKEDIEAFYWMKIWPAQMQAALSDGKTSCEAKREEFNNRLETDKEHFKVQVVEFRERFERIKDFNDFGQLSEFTLPSYNLNNDLLNATDKVDEFNKRETIFKVENTFYPELDDLIKEFAPFQDLIATAAAVNTSVNDWMTEKLATQNYSAMKEQIVEWQVKCNKLASKLEEDFPDTAQVAREVRKKVDGFAQYLPLIRCFLEESIRDEDWQQIQKVVEPAIPPEVPFDQSEIIVAEYIVEYNLNQFVGEIEDITMRAEKKYGLRKKLIEYRNEMKEFRIEQKPYKSSDTFILQNFDDVMAKLDEVIVGTQTMLGSSYMKGNLQLDCKKWERQLNDASELMEAMIKTQRDWMYLEPIFASGDISETMPKEYKMFMDVDAHWRKT